MIRGQQLTPSIAGSARLILPATATRRYLRISGVSSGAVFVTFGVENASATQGDRLAPAQPPLEYFHALMGDKMTQQVNIFNAGSTQNIYIWESFD